jgi:cysteine desulfurase
VKPLAYLDYQATTPLAHEVAAAMRPWIETNFANPHSSHRGGREAAAAIEAARELVLGALTIPLPGREGLGVGASEASLCRDLQSPAAASSRHRANPPFPPPLQGGGKLFFTSGATEAANWALKGAAARLPPNKRRIVTLATEHACVLDTVEWLSKQGLETEILPVQPDGLVDLALAAERITPATGLVAAMLVNNEIGVIQPIAELAALARAQGALFFCDAVQGFGRVPLPLDACDMVAVSAHKVHGPKGIGALWIRNGVEIDPLLHGGGQEGGLRSGTLSPALCVGFGEAARLLAERGAEDAVHVARLWANARELTSDWTLNGSAHHRYHGNLNLRRPGLDSARLISELRGIAFSSGSACASGSGRPSHVLAALGLSDRDARGSIRIGFGRYTTEDELVEALSLVNEAAARQGRFAA